MPDDPRLRLTGLADDAAAAPVLAALDDVAVDIVIGSDTRPAARLAAAATAAIAARLFHHVNVSGNPTLPPNWWDAATIPELISRIDRPRPPTSQPRRQFTVTLGLSFPASITPTVGVGGGDYLARLGTVAQPLADSDHSLGVHAAGCLAIGHLLGLALSHLGTAPVPLPETYTLSLLTHQTGAGHADIASGAPEPLKAIFAGAGSVSSSALALLSMAFASIGPHLIEIGIVDDDDFDPERNPWRYPALTGGETGSKAEHIAARLRALGFTAVGHHQTIGDWTRQQPNPGIDGLLISSVDTLGGRLQVADVLARDTLSLGVAGTALHAQRERLGDGFACPFCDYVSAAPPLTQAGVYADATGLPLDRVLQLMQPGQRLTEADVAQSAATGKLTAGRAAALPGRTLNDLVRQAYAEVQLPAAGGAGVIAVASPHVSWFAGVLAAVEITKQIQGLPLLDRRVDVDLSGLPPGLVRQMPASTTGRCVCSSGVRRRWQRGLYGAA